MSLSEHRNHFTVDAVTKFTRMCRLGDVTCVGDFLQVWRQIPNPTKLSKRYALSEYRLCFRSHPACTSNAWRITVVEGDVEVERLFQSERLSCKSILSASLYSHHDYLTFFPVPTAPGVYRPVTEWIDRAQSLLRDAWL